MDKECAIGDLEMTVRCILSPYTTRQYAISDLGLTLLQKPWAVNPKPQTPNQAVDAMTGSRQTFSVRQLRNKRRLMAFYGDKTYLKRALREAAVYRRRYMTSQMAVLAVSSDGSKREDWDLPVGAKDAQGSWLWGPASEQEWKGYFEELLEGKMQDSGETGSWIALNMRGRSCASGLGFPIIDELLGSKMPPMNIMSREDSIVGLNKDDGDVKALYDAQAKFYECLTQGKVEEMRSMWGDEQDSGVTEFIGLGGRLDPWSNQVCVCVCVMEAWSQ